MRLGPRARGASGAESESKHAQESAAQASQMADSLQKTNSHLEKLLNDERARSERLEKERRKIASELR